MISDMLSKHVGAVKKWFKINDIQLVHLLVVWYLVKLFISFKTRAKRERAVTWWNPATQTRPVLDSSSFVPVPTLPYRTCLHSASSVLALHISCRVFSMFVCRKPLFIVIMAPKRKNSDAGSASKPKRSCDVLSIIEKVKILDMIEMEKKKDLYAEIAKSYCKNEKHDFYCLCSALIEKHDFDCLWSALIEKHDFDCLWSALIEKHDFYCLWSALIEKHDFYCLCSALIEKHDFYCLWSALIEKHDFYCLCSALIEKHDFYCSVIPWNCTWYCTVHVLYFFIALPSLED